jgi:hypothetical protein
MWSQRMSPCVTNTHWQPDTYWPPDQGTIPSGVRRKGSPVLHHSPAVGLRPQQDSAGAAMGSRSGQWLIAAQVLRCGCSDWLVNTGLRV